MEVTGAKQDASRGAWGGCDALILIWDSTAEEGTGHDFTSEPYPPFVTTAPEVGPAGKTVPTTQL